MGLLNKKHKTMSKGTRCGEKDGRTLTAVPFLSNMSRYRGVKEEIR